MANHVPNQRGLADAEISELDDIMVEYNAAREQARNALIAAQAAYQATIGHASERRDDRILGIIDAAGRRGTQSRVVEYLGMNPSYLSIRLRKARNRVTNDESATPRAEAHSG
jgi:septum formation inhibitor-activating ATPase MinD